MDVTFDMWAEVGRLLKKLQSMAFGVSLHTPPGGAAPWLSEREQTSWRVNFVAEGDYYSASGDTPLAAMQEALKLCPTPQ